jgi:hypothetical protein
MFAIAFSRPPTDEELAAAASYLNALAEDRQIKTEQLLKDASVWRDLAQSLFNLKEFIYVR